MVNGVKLSHLSLFLRKNKLLHLSITAKLVLFESYELSMWHEFLTPEICMDFL